MTSSQNSDPINVQKNVFATLKNKLNIRTNLGQQISIPLIALITVTLFLSGSLLAWQVSLALQEEILARQAAVSAQATLTIETFLDRLGNELDLVAYVGDGDLVHTAEDMVAIVALEPALLEVIIIDLDGNIINSNANDEAVLGSLFTVPQAQWFIQAKLGNSYVSRLQISANNKPYVIMARPINVDGNIQGIVASRVDMLVLWETIADIKIGQTGLVYVVDQGGTLIAHPNPDVVLSGVNLSQDPDFASILNTGEGTLFTGLTGQRAVGAASTLDRVGWKVITELPTEEAFSVLRRAIGLFIGFTLLALFMSGGLVTALVKYFVQPIVALARTAQKFGEGDLSQRVAVTGENELTILAKSFNSMASQLRNLITTLEERVAARTRALEISGSVSRQLSNILNQDELVTAVVELVKEAFDYYHAHIYLFDDNRENLIMVGGTGQAGQQMLANQHQIPAGRGLVGRAGQTGQSVLVPDTAQDEAWLPNPLLPETKSEVAVPIIIGDQVLGVLDVQQSMTNGLTQADVDLLETIASQVAVGLRNANLYEVAQHDASREAMLNDINQKILKTTDVDEAMQVAIREIGRALNASHTVVRFRQAEPEKHQAVPDVPANGAHGPHG